MRERLALAALALAASTAAAEPATRYSRAPGEVIRRDGFAFGAALGPAIFYGSRGLSDVGGVGGALSLRFATVATPTLLWVAAVESGNYAARIVDQADPDAAENTLATHSLLTIGGQLYLREALWLGIGGGLAFFLREEADGAAIEDTRRAGLSGYGRVGLDLFRRGRFALDGEAAVHLTRFRGGDGLVQTTLGLGATWY